MQNASRWLLAGVLGTSTTVSQAATLEERMAAFEARASAAEKRAAAAEQQTQALARELQQLKLSTPVAQPAAPTSASTVAASSQPALDDRVAKLEARQQSMEKPGSAGHLTDGFSFKGYARSGLVAVTAFGYESGQAVTFYQGRGTIEPWLRHRRIGRPTQLTVDHLLASSAIPLLFAPVMLDQEYFGDGAVRQSAPISPALHLGANRVLVVGVSGNPRGLKTERPAPRAPIGIQPSLAQISGHMLNSTFIDNLESDIELLERLNMASALLPCDQIRQPGMEPVEVLVISPSRPLDEIAARHRRELPPALRTFLRGPGATKSSGASVLSYLLFESGYCSELIELGRHDAIAQGAELKRFLRLT